MIKKINIAFMATLLIFLFFMVSDGEVLDRIVAVVNEDIITLVDLDKALKPYYLELEKTAYPVEKKEAVINKLRREMVEKLVEFKLIEHEAERLHIRVTDKELKAAIDRTLDEQGITEDELKQALLKEKITFEQYKNDMRSKILQPKLINRIIKANVIITDEEVEKYYGNHLDQYKGSKKYYLKNILNPSEQVIEMARELLDQGHDFSEIAKKYSTAPNAAAGGDLGSFELDAFADNIKDSIESLEKGQYTDVILTDGGFQIFFIENIELTKGKTVQAVKDEIVRKLYAAKAEKKYYEWLKGLKEKSLVKIML